MAVWVLRGAGIYSGVQAWQTKEGKMDMGNHKLREQLTARACIGGTGSVGGLAKGVRKQGAKYGGTRGGD